MPKFQGAKAPYPNLETPLSTVLFRLSKPVQCAALLLCFILLLAIIKSSVRCVPTMVFSLSVSDNIHDSSHCLFLRDVVSLYPSMPLFVFLDYVLPPRDNMMPLLVISCRPFLLYMTKPCQSSLSDPVDQ